MPSRPTAHKDLVSSSLTSYRKPSASSHRRSPQAEIQWGVDAAYARLADPGLCFDRSGAGEAARAWVQSFATWDNTEHRHSAIRFVTPDQRHRGEDRALLAYRHQVYELARAARPDRWSGQTRNWHPIGPVWLNPERPETGRRAHGSADALIQEAGGGGPMAGKAKRAA